MHVSLDLAILLLEICYKEIGRWLKLYVQYDNISILITEIVVIIMIIMITSIAYYYVSGTVLNFMR